MSGLWRFRSGWWGKLVLQRGTSLPAMPPGSGRITHWRDATTEDLIDFIKENHP